TFLLFKRFFYFISIFNHTSYIYLNGHPCKWNFNCQLNYLICNRFSYIRYRNDSITILSICLFYLGIILFLWYSDVIIFISYVFIRYHVLLLNVIHQVCILFSYLFILFNLIYSKMLYAILKVFLLLKFWLPFDPY